MHRALTNDDVLCYILAFTDTPTKASCMRVCKLWFDSGIKYLWRTVDDMWRCFEILAPIIPDGESGTYVSSDCN